MTFEGNVVEIRQVFWKLFGILALFNNVLLFIPMPWAINFSKIFDDERIALDSFLFHTENSNTFRMNLKMLLILFRQIHNSIIHNLSNYFVFWQIFCGKNFIGKVGIDDIFQGEFDVIALFALLLDSVSELLGDEITLGRVLHVFGTNHHEINCGTSVHTPSYFFFNVHIES